LRKVPREPQLLVNKDDLEPAYHFIYILFEDLKKTVKKGWPDAEEKNTKAVIPAGESSRVLHHLPIRTRRIPEPKKIKGEAPALTAPEVLLAGNPWDQQRIPDCKNRCRRKQRAPGWRPTARNRGPGGLLVCITYLIHTRIYLSSGIKKYQKAV